MSLPKLPEPDADAVKRFGPPTYTREFVLAFQAATVEAIGARHHWAAFEAGARAIEAVIRSKT
jgi:hypothetical protein